MGLMDNFTDALAGQVSATLSADAKARIAALFTTRAVLPDADVYDCIRLARFILTGNEDIPEPPQTEGFTVELGGQVFSQAQWEAVQVYATGTSAMVAQHPTLRVGDPVSVEDSDGKGVSGYVTSWGAAAGGHPFMIQADAQPPLPSETVESRNGDTVSTADVPVPDADPEPGEIPGLLTATDPAPTAGEGWSGRRG